MSHADGAGYQVTDCIAYDGTYVYGTQMAVINRTVQMYLFGAVEDNQPLIADYACPEVTTTSSFCTKAFPAGHNVSWAFPTGFRADLGGIESGNGTAAFYIS